MDYLVYCFTFLLLLHGVEGVASEPDCMYPRDMPLKKPIVINGPGMPGSGISHSIPVMPIHNNHELHNNMMDTLVTSSSANLQPISQSTPEPAINRALVERIMQQEQNSEQPTAPINPKKINFMNDPQTRSDCQMKKIIDEHLNEIVNDPVVVNSFIQNGETSNLSPEAMKRMILGQMATSPESRKFFPPDVNSMSQLRKRQRMITYGDMPLMPQIKSLPSGRPLIQGGPIPAIPPRPYFRPPVYPQMKRSFFRRQPVYPSLQSPFMRRPFLPPPRRPFYPYSKSPFLTTPLPTPLRTYPKAPRHLRKFMPSLQNRKSPLMPLSPQRRRHYIRHLFRRLFKRHHHTYYDTRYWSHWSRVTMHHYLQEYRHWRRIQSKAKTIKVGKQQVKRAMQYLMWINQNTFYARKLQKAEQKRIKRMQHRWIGGMGRWWLHQQRYRRYTPYVYHRARNPRVYYPYHAYYSPTHYPIHHYYPPPGVDSSFKPKKPRLVRYRLVQV